MAVATFDTLKFANTLKAAGVPEKQAEAEAVAFAEVLQVNFKELATKTDLDRAVTDIRTELHSSLADVRREMVELRTELRSEVSEFRSQMHSDLAGLKAEVRDLLQQHHAKVDGWMTKKEGEIALLRWMSGVVTLGVLGL